MCNLGTRRPDKRWTAPTNDSWAVFEVRGAWWHDETSVGCSLAVRLDVSVGRGRRRAGSAALRSMQ